jgi:cyclophilin family peptidyl-prolyl cis-trans isomerase/protein-disulfide isomerase
MRTRRYRRITYSPFILTLISIILLVLLPACSTPTSITPSSLPTEVRTAAQLGPTLTPTNPPPSSTPPPPEPTLVPIPATSDTDWSRGPADAPVTFLIFSDLQCPYCARLHPMLEELLELHPDDLQIVFRHFPLPVLHDKAYLAGQAAEAAGLQGHFWEMHDLLYERQMEWTGLSPEEFEAWLKSVLPEIGLDEDLFMEVIESGQFLDDMEAHFLSGISYGLAGTPSIFINDFYFQLEPSLSLLEAYIRLELMDANRQLDYPPYSLSEGKVYLAHLELNIGEVILQLYPDSAPLAVNNFIYLAEQGWYDDNPIFRVIPGRLVEAGDPSGTGFVDQGYHYTIETDPALVFDQPGFVAVSSSGPNTNGSRFFITLAALPEFDGTRTIFGKVIEGLELLSNLEAREPMEDLLSAPQVIIKTITIEEK